MSVGLANSLVVAGLGFSIQCRYSRVVADLGSDPNSAHRSSHRHQRPTELGSDPNSAACYSLPTRQARWAASSYWSTRNRQPPAAPAWLDAALILTSHCRHGLEGLAFTSQCQRTHVIADLGSDPNSAASFLFRHERLTELGSDPNSAANRKAVHSSRARQ